MINAVFVLWVYFERIHEVHLALVLLSSMASWSDGTALLSAACLKDGGSVKAAHTNATVRFEQPRLTTCRGIS